MNAWIDSCSCRFTDPWLLTLLIPAVLLPLALRRGFRWWQGAALVMLALAVAGPVLDGVRGKPSVHVLCAPGTPEREIAARHPGATLHSVSGTPGAELARIGAGIGDGGGVIHWYGPRHDPDGVVDRTALELFRRGIPVFIHRRNAGTDRSALKNLRAPLVSAAGETLALELELSVPDGKQPKVELYGNGKRLAAARGTSVGGECRLKLEFVTPEPGEHVLTLALDGRSIAELPLRADPPTPAAIIAETRTEAEAVAALLPHFGIERFTGDRAFGDHPLLILSPRAAEQLSPEKAAKLSAAIENGAGLLVFAERTPPTRRGATPEAFNALLPLRYRTTSLDRTPDTSLVIIIDTSGSMSGNRLALAREVARMALDRLNENDRCGIIEFHGRRRWAAPLQSAANHLELHRALNRLTAGGGTVILPALREAFYALRNSGTRLKHVLVITDGGVEHGDFETLTREMARFDITVSTVLAGAGESDFLTRLATWGNGRFYKAAGRFAVPELSFRQSGSEERPPWREGRFKVERRCDSEMLRALPETLTVGGTFDCEADLGAEVLLSAGGKPLLARRRRGLGTVAVLNAAPGGKWGRELMAVPEFRGLLSALARSLPDPAKLRRFDFRDRSVRRDIHIAIDALDAPAELTVVLESDRTSPEEFILTAGEDGAFHFRRAGLAPGIYRLGIKDSSESVRFASRSFPEAGDGNAEKRSAEEINRRSARLTVPEYSLRRVRLRPLFCWGFIVLMLTQILLRRLPRKTVMPLLLLALQLSPGTLRGGDCASFLTAGLLGRSPEQAFLLAERSAETAADRRFARLLRLETARSRGKLPALLAEYRKHAAADPELRELLINELEESGAFEEALAWLEKHPASGGVRISPQLIRLAEKCGKSHIIRQRLDRALKRDPGDRFALETSIRLELLDGRREEAKNRLRDAVIREKDPQFLAGLSAVAAEVMLYDEALLALEKLEVLSPGERWQIRFRKAALLREQHGTSRAAAALERMADETALPENIRLSLADRCEQFGDVATAERLYRQGGDEESRIRLAMLLENTGNSVTAAQEWEKVMRGSDNEMRAIQAAERLILIHSKGGTLKEFIRRLRNDPELSGDRRLKRLYCRALAAAGKQEALFSFLAASPDNDRTRLDFLLEFKRYDEASALLAEMLERHPAERGALLRQQAVLAVESENLKLAEASLAAIRKNAGDPASAAGFAAEVYMLLNNPQRAVELYDECLKLAPERYELHLLRANALKASGAREQAIREFASRLDDRVPPELFGVMVDGLLNMEAPHGILRTALAAVMRRIRVSPEQLFYYRLAEDLADELADAPLRRRLSKMQLAVAPERRELLLRELFEEARLRDDRQEAERCARLLLNLKGVYPPELYHSLCRTLAENGGFAAAERGVRDADAVEGGTRNRFLFIDSCLDLGRITDAARICRELMSLTPEEPELLEKNALIRELQGDFRAAGEIRVRVLKIRSRRLAFADLKTPGTLRELRRLANAAAAHHVRYGIAVPASPDTDRIAKAAEAMIKKRIAELTAPPKAPPRKKRAARQLTPAEVAEKIAVLPPEKGAKLAADFLDAAPHEWRSALFARLLGELFTEPSPQLAAVLEERLDRLELRESGFAEFRLPVAIKQKLRFAERMLNRYPKSLNALALYARMCWLDGRPGAARLLAEELYSRFLELESPALPIVRRIRELGIVYAAAPGEAEHAGAEALERLIASLDEDRELLGDTPQRALLAALLRENAGRRDEAARILFDQWSRGGRTLALFKAMEELTLDTGKYDDFLRVIEHHAPKDQMTEVLYHRRLVQLLRDSGRAGEALMRLSALPPALQRREKLLLLDAISADKYAAELRRFLLEEVRSGRFTGYFSSDFGTVERHGRTMRPPRKADRQFRETLEYLLLGVAATEPAFPALLELRIAVGGPRASRFAATAYRTPGGTMLRAALGEPLSPGDLKRVDALIGAPKIPALTAERIIKLLPETRRSPAAEILAERMLADRMTERDLSVLDRVLPLTTASWRKNLAGKLENAETLGDPAKCRLTKRALVKRFAPEWTACVKPPVPPNRDIYIADGLGTPEMRLERFFAITGRAPEWRCLFPLLSVEEQNALPEAVERSVSGAVRRRLMTREAAERNYSMLAAADPARREHWLKLAASYAARTSEPKNTRKHPKP